MNTELDDQINIISRIVGFMTARVPIFLGEEDLPVLAGLHRRLVMLRTPTGPRSSCRTCHSSLPVLGATLQCDRPDCPGKELSETKERELAARQKGMP